MPSVFPSWRTRWRICWVDPLLLTRFTKIFRIWTKGMKVSRLLVILVVVGMLSVTLHWCLKGNAPYAVEVRRMGPDGVAVYERKTPERGWPFSANIAAIRRHS